jgi:hypothetical protein
MFPWDRKSVEDRYLHEIGVKLNWSRNSTDRQSRIVFGPEDPDKLRAVYERNSKDFEETALCQRITSLVTPLFERKKTNKIVSFGAMGLAVGTSDPGNMLTLRDIWKKTNPNAGQLKIYLQDPQYSKIDDVVAKQNDMTIVNCRPGHQLGWLQVDDFTLVVDWVACFPVIELALEIARPAGIFSTDIIPSFRAKDYWACTIKREGKEIQCPGLGR